MHTSGRNWVSRHTRAWITPSTLKWAWLTLISGAAAVALFAYSSPSGNYLLPAFVRVWISCISTQTRYPQPASRNSFVFINNPATKFVSLYRGAQQQRRRPIQGSAIQVQAHAVPNKYIQIPIMYCSRSSRLAHRWNSSFDKWKGRVVDAENPAGEFVNSKNKATRCYAHIYMCVYPSSAITVQCGFILLFSFLLHSARRSACASTQRDFLITIKYTWRDCWREVNYESAGRWLDWDIIRKTGPSFMTALCKTSPALWQPSDLLIYQSSKTTYWLYALI
jgi:hypothetical protein